MIIQPLNRPLIFLVAMVLLVSIELLVVQSPAFSRNPATLSLAVLFDLTVVSSGLFFRLLARPRNWSAIRTLLVAILMLRLGLFILPATLNGPTLLALAEIGPLVIAGFRISLMRATYLKLRSTSTVNDALHGAFSAVFGNQAAGFILGEWQVISYALLGWRLKPDIPTGATTLTTHRDSGQIALTVALGIVGLIELVGLHLLLARWNADVAFGLTIVSAYSLQILVADLVAIIKRPSYQTAEALYLRLGIRWQAVIPREQIIRIERIHDKPAKKNGLLNAALLTAPNVLLTLEKPILVQGPYGIRKEAIQLALWIDGGIAAMA